jgi:hypothetical protein
MTRRKPFLVGLFSVLAFTSVLAVVTEALATHICRTCRHGTVSGTGSSYAGSISITDDSLTLEETPGAAGFFDAKASTPAGQFIECKFNDGSSETDALCAYPEFEEGGQVKAGITCSRFEKGGCAQQGQNPGTRTSIMSCNTVGAGCTGKIQIFALDGKTPLTPAPIEIGKDLELIVGTNQCNNEFPTTPGQDGLKKTEMGKILQTSCTSKQDPWDANEPVSRMVVRTDLNGNGVPKYNSVTTALLGVDATCSPDDGFPAISCTNNSIVRSTFEASSAACSTETLRCGQKSNLEQGPRPSECTFDSLSNLCTCTCPKCDPTTGESLADVDVPPSPGIQGSGNYVVWNQTSAAMCTVKIGGN